MSPPPRSPSLGPGGAARAGRFGCLARSRRSTTASPRDMARRPLPSGTATVVCGHGRPSSAVMATVVCGWWPRFSNGTARHPGWCDRATGTRKAHSIELACVLPGWAHAPPGQAGARAPGRRVPRLADQSRRALQANGDTRGLALRVGRVSCPLRGMALAALILSPTDLERSLLVAGRGGGLAVPPGDRGMPPAAGVQGPPHPVGGLRGRGPVGAPEVPRRDGTAPVPDRAETGGMLPAGEPPPMVGRPIRRRRHGRSAFGC
ncbi:MAG: hypothetical protein JWP48_4327 [Actinoallomurus sp.]|jgi:hypothetical protein|nr:hypothetical protein [Actinoallomurus sp.]